MSPWSSQVISLNFGLILNIMGIALWHYQDYIRYYDFFLGLFDCQGKGDTPDHFSLNSYNVSLLDEKATNPYKDSSSLPSNLDIISLNGSLKPPFSHTLPPLFIPIPSIDSWLLHPSFVFRCSKSLSPSR